MAIDEFKLHNNRVYATVIINLTNGHALWLAKGKGKDTITSFIDHVGLDWMKNVQAVACDMNANFADTFTEACPHIRIVYDHFHIVKNFNEKVVSEVRKDEYRRLMDEGRTAEAQKLKRSRFILTASRKTLAKRDKEAKEGKAYGRNSKLFNLQSKPKKDGNLIKYEALLAVVSTILQDNPYPALFLLKMCTQQHLR